MSLEVPTLRVHHAKSAAALSRAQQLLVEKFGPMEGSKIKFLRHQPEAVGLRVQASNPPGIDIYHSGTDLEVVTAELWVPIGNGVQDNGADYTITRKTVLEEGSRLTEVVIEQSHRLLVHFGSGVDINGAMSAKVVRTTTEEVHDHDTGDSGKKVAEKSNTKFIRDAGEIDVFFDNALRAITLK